VKKIIGAIIQVCHHPAAYQTNNITIHDRTNHWINVLGLSGWSISIKAISKEAVIYADDVPIEDRYFVGVQINKEKMHAIIYHDRSLTDEYVVHELLHVKHPDWSEDQVNAETERLLNQNKDEQKEKTQSR